MHSILFCIHFKCTAEWLDNYVAPDISSLVVESTFTAWRNRCTAHLRKFSSSRTETLCPFRNSLSLLPSALRSPSFTSCFWESDCSQPPTQRESHGVCSAVPDLFHTARLQGSPTLRHVSECLSFFGLNDIPLY